MPLLLLLACSDAGSADSDSGVLTPEDPLARFLEVGELPEQSLLIDVRSADEYADGHIPGAVNVPWGDLRAEVMGISGQLAAPQVISEAFAGVGLEKEQAVLLYDARSSRDAGRLAWSLEVSGHSAPVQILDGGWLQWSEQGLETSTQDAELEPSEWQAQAPDPVLINADWIFERLDDPDLWILDVRTPEEFASGHIPGAVNVEWSRSTYSEGSQVGKLLPEGELEALYAGLPKDATVVVSCQSGARAGHSWAVLPTLGFQDVRLYDGSWNEWSSRDELPVEY